MQKSEDSMSEDALSLGSVYLHIRNLPWASCHGDIETYLKGFTIPKGGILIHGSEAFVVVQDYESSFDRSMQDFTACSMQILEINKRNIMTAAFRNVRRCLTFNDETINQEMSKIPFTAIKRKRITPTPIPKGHKRIPFSCSAFSTEEVKHPFPVKHRSKSDGYCPYEMSEVCGSYVGSKRIRPEPVRLTEDWKIVPEDGCKVKKIKLEEYAVGDSLRAM